MFRTTSRRGWRCRPRASRRLLTETLESRRLLATLELAPAAGAGTVSEENGDTVLTVQAGATVEVTASVDTAEQAVQGIQLNLSNSASELAIDNFTLGSDFPVAADETLDSSTGDFFVASALIGQLTIPPPRVLGTFDVTAPTAAGDYRVTSNFVTGTELTNTLLSTPSGGTLPITDFGDLIIRVASPPATIDLVPQANGGTVSEENGNTVITVTSGTAVNVTAQVASADVDVQGVQLNLSNSNANVGLGNFTLGSDFPVAADQTLDSTSGDFFVASAVIGQLTVPPPRELGTFVATPPTAPGDYLVSANFTSGGELTDTLISDSAGNALTITDFGDLIIRVVDAPPVVTFATASQSESEDVGTMTITATLSRAVSETVSVPFSVDGSAEEGVDFSITASPIVFAAGSTSETVTITVTDDNEDEQDETVIVTLGTPTGATLGATTVHTATIVDNDLPQASLDLVPSGGTVSEENGMTVVSVAGGATVTVTAQVATAETDVQGFQLNLSNSDTQLTLDNFNLGTDFPVGADEVLDSSVDDFFVSAAVIGQLTVPPPRLFGDFDVTAPTAPGDYTVTANFTTGGELSNTILTDADGGTFAISDFGDLIIRVLPPLPTVSLDAATQEVAEDVGTVSVTLSLSQASDSVVTVPFTVSGTADDGTDFTISSSPVTFAAGVTSAAVTVNVTDDSEDETAETVVVALGTPTGATLGSTTTQTVTINDNDDAPIPTVSLTESSQSQIESIGTMTVTASLSAPTDVDVTVPFSIDGTATVGTDFTITASPLTITAGTTSASITIDVINDSEDETNETVVVTLGTPSGANLGATTVHTATIVDDDGATNDNRILIPDRVARPYVIPGDGRQTAVLFEAVVDTVLSVGRIGVTSLTPQVSLVTESLTPLGSRNEVGFFSANLIAGQKYALIFEARSTESTFFVRSSRGIGSLGGTDITTNFLFPTDVNADGSTNGSDALLVINELDRRTSGEGEFVGTADKPRFLDVNSDGRVAPSDALRIINRLADQTGDSAQQTAGAESRAVDSNTTPDDRGSILGVTTQPESEPTIMAGDVPVASAEPVARASESPIVEDANPVHAALRDVAANVDDLLSQVDFINGLHT